MKKDNLLVIAGISILILLVIALIQMFTGNNTNTNTIPSFGVNQGSNDQNTQPEEDFVVPVPNTPDEIVVESTGGRGMPVTQEQATSIDQFRSLRLKLPLETDSFSMSKFNFDTFKITVTFKAGFVGDKNQALEQWLNTNGYGSVERTNFQIL